MKTLTGFSEIFFSSWKNIGAAWRSFMLGILLYSIFVGGVMFFFYSVNIGLIHLDRETAMWMSSMLNVLAFLVAFLSVNYFIAAAILKKNTWDIISSNTRMMAHIGVVVVVFLIKTFAWVLLILPFAASAFEIPEETMVIVHGIAFFVVIVLASKYFVGPFAVKECEFMPDRCMALSAKATQGHRFAVVVDLLLLEIIWWLIGFLLAIPFGILVVSGSLAAEGGDRIIPFSIGAAYSVLIAFPLALSICQRISFYHELSQRISPNAEKQQA